MRAHICKQGESMQVLAEMYNIDLNLLMSHNQHVKDPANIQEGTQITIPSLLGLEGMVPDLNEGKGNVCAFVGDEPVHYKKLNITKWPSQEGYGIPHTVLSIPEPGHIHLNNNNHTQQHQPGHTAAHQQPMYYAQYQYPGVQYNPYNWQRNHMYYQQAWMQQHR